MGEQRSVTGHLPRYPSCFPNLAVLVKATVLAKCGQHRETVVTASGHLPEYPSCFPIAVPIIVVVLAKWGSAKGNSGDGALTKLQG